MVEMGKLIVNMTFVCFIQLFLYRLIKAILIIMLNNCFTLNNCDQPGRPTTESYAKSYNHCFQAQYMETVNVEWHVVLLVVIVPRVDGVLCVTVTQEFPESASLVLDDSFILQRILYPYW